jgi:23S rRNA pseudouridine2457 synthase
MTHRYLVFNKPFNVLSQFTRGSGGDALTDRNRLTLAEFIPVPNVYPVGRLDFDSEGLMLLSDDGNFQHLLTDPRFAHDRTYWVQVEGIPTDEALHRLREGVTIQGYRTKPCEVQLLAEPLFPARNPPIRFRKSIPTSWVELTLREGRNRQVRRMTAAVGLPTLRLIRVAIGTIRLDGLTPGIWRNLSPEEVLSLRKTNGAKEKGGLSRAAQARAAIPTRGSGESKTYRP